MGGGGGGGGAWVFVFGKVLPGLEVHSNLFYFNPDWLWSKIQQFILRYVINLSFTG